MIAAQKRMATKAGEMNTSSAAVSGRSPGASPRPGNTSPALKQGTAANMVEKLIERNIDKIVEEAYQPRLRGRNSTAWDPLYNGDPTFEVPIEVAPLNSQGTPMQIGRHACGLAVTEGGMRDVGFAAVTEMENAQAALKSDNFGRSVGLGGPEARFERCGMTTTHLSRHLADHGANVRTAEVHGMSTLAPLVQGVKQGKQYYFLINNGSIADPSCHWVRFEGMTCSAGKSWVHIGDPWQGASFKMPPRMFTTRARAFVEADWTDLLVEMHGTTR